VRPIFGRSEVSLPLDLGPGNLHQPPAIEADASFGVVAIRHQADHNDDLRKSPLNGQHRASCASNPFDVSASAAAPDNQVRPSSPEDSC
jgi:hypothetical protein